MRTLRQYDLMGNMEDAHYLMYTLDAVHRTGLVRSNQPEAPRQGATSSFTTKKPSCDIDLAEKVSNVAAPLSTSVGLTATFRTEKPKRDPTEAPIGIRQGCGQQDHAHGKVAQVGQLGETASEREGDITSRGSTISRKSTEVDACNKVCTFENLA